MTALGLIAALGSVSMMMAIEVGAMELEMKHVVTVGLFVVAAIVDSLRQSLK